MDCSLPGFSVQGILQARALEWAAVSFSSGQGRLGEKKQRLLVFSGFGSFPVVLDRYVAPEFLVALAPPGRLATWDT